MSDADVLSSLPPLRWGGTLAPPYDLLDVSWENGLAPRRIPYLDGEVHDDVGRGSFPLSARLYFLNTLGSTGLGQLYPAYWQKWLPLLLSGEARTLDHPALGSLRARVKGAKYQVVEKCRSGIIVDVQWVETVEDPSLINVNGYSGITLPSAAAAQAADAAMAPWISQDPTLAFGFGRPPQSLATQYGLNLSLLTGSIGIAFVFTSIQPALFSATSQSARLLAALMGDVDVMIQSLARKNSVFAYDATDKMILFWLACDNMRKGMASSGRKKATLVTTQATTLDQIADQTSNSLKDLIGLNLTLIRQPTIPRGTAVTYYPVGL